jgi:hypothetical protein
MDRHWTIFQLTLRDLWLCFYFHFYSYGYGCVPVSFHEVVTGIPSLVYDNWVCCDSRGCFYLHTSLLLGNLVFSREIFFPHSLIKRALLNIDHLGNYICLRCPALLLNASLLFLCSHAYISILKKSSAYGGPMHIPDAFLWCSLCIIHSLMVHFLFVDGFHPAFRDRPREQTVEFCVLASLPERLWQDPIKHTNLAFHGEQVCFG